MFGNSKKDTYRYGSVEVNLVPDVKFEFIRAEIMRSRVTTVAILTIIVAAVAVALLSLVTFGLQSYLISSTDKKIDEQFRLYKDYTGVNQIITIQNQLSKIDDLHQDKPISSRLFNMMVSMIDGSGKSVKISRLDFDKATSEVRIEGQSGDGFIGLERMQKSITGTTISYKDADETIMESLTDRISTNESPSYGQDSLGNQVLIFNISFIANKNVFNSSKEITMVGPGRQDVTDSTTVIPKDIFTPKADKLPKDGAPAVDNTKEGSEG